MALTSRQARINGRKGGRKKGTRTPAVLEREAAGRLLRQRIAAHADQLFEAQFTLARGCTELYKLKDGKVRKVGDTATIKRYLLGELSEADGYHWITRERPDGPAIRDMLDRAFDRPMQLQQHTLQGAGGGPVTIVNEILPPLPAPKVIEGHVVLPSSSTSGSE